MITIFGLAPEDRVVGPGWDAVDDGRVVLRDGPAMGTGDTILAARDYAAPVTTPHASGQSHLPGTSDRSGSGCPVVVPDRGSSGVARFLITDVQPERRILVGHQRGIGRATRNAHRFMPSTKSNSPRG